MTMTETKQATALIETTMELVDQISMLEHLIATTPADSPSIVIQVSPELARHILETRNDANRHLRPIKIKRFADDLTSGLWVVTGDTLKFGMNGVLLDGQNRLRACLLSDVPLRTHVVFGIDPIAFKVLDSGAGRTNGDTFQVAGVENAALTAKAVRWLMITAQPHIDRGMTIGNAELFEYYQKRVAKDLLQTQIARAKLVRATLPRGTLAAMLYMATKKDQEKAAIFAHDLEREVRSAKHLLAKVDHLREQTGNRVNERNIVNLISLTWAAYRNDAPIKRRDQLRWTDDEPDVPIA